MNYEKYIRYNTIVIGSTLPALLYSFANNIPFLTTTKIEPPNPFDRFFNDLILKSYYLENKLIEWKSPFNPSKLVGIEKYILWQRLWTILSMAGLNPMNNKPESLIIIDENRIHAPFGGFIRKFEFDKLIIFSDTNVVNLPHSLIDDASIPKKVYDYFKVTWAAEIGYDFMELEGELCKDTQFYNLYGPPNATSRKDIIGISNLTDEQLQMDENSDIEARFKMRYFIKEISKNIKFESDGREIIPTRMRKYENIKNIEFCYDTDEYLIQTSFIKDSYASRLVEKLNG